MFAAPSSHDRSTWLVRNGRIGLVRLGKKGKMVLKCEMRGKGLLRAEFN